MWDLGWETKRLMMQAITRISAMIPSAVCLWPVPYPQVNKVDSSTTPPTAAADKAQEGPFSLGSGLAQNNHTK